MLKIPPGVFGYLEVFIKIVGVKCQVFGVRKERIVSDT